MEVALSSQVEHYKRMNVALTLGPLHVHYMYRVSAPRAPASMSFTSPPACLQAPEIEISVRHVRRQRETDRMRIQSHLSLLAMVLCI